MYVYSVFDAYIQYFNLFVSINQLHIINLIKLNTIDS